MPKQLLAIVGRRSLLQDTVARIAPLVPAARIVVVTGTLQARAVRAQLPALGRSNVLAEPQGRNTAAAIALAALWIARRTPDAVMTVLPADHAIGDADVFRADLRLAQEVAERSGALVTLGVPPTHPETGYGYIRPAGHGTTRARVARVRAFIEKPSRARAAALVAARGTLWNTGIFVWRVSTILAALRALVPAVVEPLAAAVRDGSRAALAAAYRRLPAVSIDHGVLEHARDVRVVRARFEWSDVGSWAAVAALWADARNGRNAVRGHALPLDSRGCLVDSPERLVALVGVEDLVVVDSPDALLVCRKDRAQDVRLVVEELRRRRLTRYL